MILSADRQIVLSGKSVSVLLFLVVLLFFIQQKKEYEMRISDWSSDVCSSDLNPRPICRPPPWRRPKPPAHNVLRCRAGRRERKGCSAPPAPLSGDLPRSVRAEGFQRHHLRSSSHE